ncbi:MAG: hypothetical protein PHE78_00790 [Candidatus Gastranaerophilales bacterium]|nr:hypothetical protein [Candidatus Gastranaerophilales bacterium]
MTNVSSEIYLKNFNSWIIKDESTEAIKKFWDEAKQEGNNIQKSMQITQESLSRVIGI